MRGLFGQFWQRFGRRAGVPGRRVARPGGSPAVSAVNAASVDLYVDLHRTLVRLLPEINNRVDHDMLKAGARKLGRLDGNLVYLRNEEEWALLMQFCIQTPLHGPTPVERCLQQAVAREGSLEEAVLQSMLDSYFSVFRIEKVVAAAGVGLRDLVSGESVFMHNVNFGSTAERGLVFATYLVTLRGITMSAGAIAPLQAEALQEARAVIERTVHGSSHPADSPRLSREQQAALAEEILRLSLACGATASLRRIEPGDVERLEQLKRTERIGRLPEMDEMVLVLEPDPEDEGVSGSGGGLAYLASCGRPSGSRNRKRRSRKRNRKPRHRRR